MQFMVSQISQDFSFFDKTELKEQTSVTVSLSNYRVRANRSRYCAPYLSPSVLTHLLQITYYKF